VNLTRSILLIAIFSMLGSMNAMTSKVSSKTVLDKNQLCIPCTSYCKTHPNADRCN
jgi:hypothetical protein